MTRNAFDELCTKIIMMVGESTFKSETYINNFLCGGDHNIYKAHEVTSGGFVSGKIKLGITLRLLTGGSCYDLGVIFDIAPLYCNYILFYVLKNWIIDTDIVDINMHSYLEDTMAMSKVSEGFSLRADGFLKGAIGAIDGWLVRIVRLSKHLDGIDHSASFFSLGRLFMH